MKKVEYKKGSHSKYLLRYHFVMCTKYRHKILTGEIEVEIKKILEDISKAEAKNLSTAAIIEQARWAMLEYSEKEANEAEARSYIRLARQRSGYANNFPNAKNLEFKLLFNEIISNSFPLHLPALYC